MTEVERIPGFAGDVIKSVQALPGVARPTMDNPGAIVVRGSGNYDTRFFLDGVDIPLLFHYGGLKSTYSLAGPRERRHVSRAASARATARPSAASSRSRAGPAAPTAGTPSWTRACSTAASTSRARSANNATLLLTGRRSFIGEVTKAALESQDDVSLQIAPYYWDVVGRLDWRPRRQTTTSSSPPSRPRTAWR